MSSPTLQWYRIEIDAAGKTLSLRAVDGPATAAGGVFYVLAKSPELAARLVYNQHHAVLLRARRKQYAAEGKCRCGRPRDRQTDRGKVEPRCSHCLAQQSNDNKRRALREKGIEVPRPDRREAIAARKDHEDGLIRLSVLDEIDEVWRTKGIAGVRIWMRRERARLSKERAA